MKRKLKRYLDVSAVYCCVLCLGTHPGGGGGGEEY
jgi:hypothetical protein